MHFPSPTTLLTLSLATIPLTAATHHHHARDLTASQWLRRHQQHRRAVADAAGYLSTALKSFQDLDAAVVAYQGGDGSSLQAASDKTLATLGEITNGVNGMSELSLADIMGLQRQGDAFEAATTKLLADVNLKKDAFAKAGICGDVYRDLTQIGTATDTLIKTAIPKVPAEAQSFSGPVVEVFDKSFGETKDNLSSCAGDSNSNTNSNNSPASSSPAANGYVAPASTSSEKKAAPAASTTTSTPATDISTAAPVEAPGSTSESCTEEATMSPSTSSIDTSTSTSTIYAVIATSSTLKAPVTPTTNGTVVPTYVQVAGVGKMAISGGALGVAMAVLMI